MLPAGPRCLKGTGTDYHSVEPINCLDSQEDSISDGRGTGGKQAGKRVPFNPFAGNKAPPSNKCEGHFLMSKSPLEIQVSKMISHPE